MTLDSASSSSLSNSTGSSSGESTILKKSGKKKFSTKKFHIDKKKYEKKFSFFDSSLKKDFKVCEEVNDNLYSMIDTYKEEIKYLNKDLKQVMKKNKTLKKELKKCNDDKQNPFGLHPALLKEKGLYQFFGENEKDTEHVLEKYVQKQKGYVGLTGKDSINVGKFKVQLASPSKDDGKQGEGEGQQGKDQGKTAPKYKKIKDHRNPNTIDYEFYPATITTQINNALQKLIKNREQIIKLSGDVGKLNIDLGEEKKNYHEDMVNANANTKNTNPNLFGPQKSNEDNITNEFNIKKRNIENNINKQIKLQNTYKIEMQNNIHTIEGILIGVDLALIETNQYENMNSFKTYAEGLAL
jgi:hypothetical protein